MVQFKLLIHVQDSNYAFAKLAPGVRTALIRRDRLADFIITLKLNGIKDSNQFLVQQGLTQLQSLTLTDFSEGFCADWLHADLSDVERLVSSYREGISHV
jgi:hypothetical protein